MLPGAESVGFLVVSVFDTIIYDKRDGIAHVGLNRPHLHNAFNVAMRDDLFQVLQAVRDDPGVKVVIISGEGPSFCAGADLSEFGTAPSPTIAREVRWERDVWGLFLGLPKPIIAAIHGYCIGSGVETAMLCDLRIAGDDARFSMPEVALGLVPAAGGTQTLPRTVGVPAALDLLLTAREVDAAEALHLGLVGRVVPADRLLQEAEAIAHNLLQMDQWALQAAKEAVVRGADMSLEASLDLESRLALSAMGSPGS